MATRASARYRLILRGPAAHVPAPPRRRRRWWRLLLVVGPVLAILGVAIYLAQLPLFPVTMVKVSGTRHLDAAVVAEQAGVRGRNLFAVDTGRVARDLAHSPWVRRVTVNRHPFNEVAIDVEEREPVLIWQLPDQPLLVAADGMVLGPAPAAAPWPRVIERSDQRFAAGDKLPLDLVQGALQLQAQIGSRLQVRLAELRHEPELGLTAVTDGGWRAAFGDGLSLDYELATLKEIMSQAQARKLAVSFVDLRFPGRPYVR